MYITCLVDLTIIFSFFFLESWFVKEMSGWGWLDLFDLFDLFIFFISFLYQIIG